ncbi:MAG: hypothetical protein U7123_12715 [Potamolinea sp.]
MSKHKLLLNSRCQLFHLVLCIHQDLLVTPNPREMPQLQRLATLDLWN